VAYSALPLDHSVMEEIKMFEIEKYGAYTFSIVIQGRREE
jgi:hypothetical protein